MQNDSHGKRSTISMEDVKVRVLWHHALRHVYTLLRLTHLTPFSYVREEMTAW
jgi:hypothetical protein